MWPDQDFEELFSHHLHDNSLFEDSEFPARVTSVYYSKKVRDIVWKRPGELVKDPQFFVEGASRFDVDQGEFGDRWLMAAIANLTLNEACFQCVVPPDQSFTPGYYAGIFHFRFWQHGKWIDVVIDDRLPTKNGKLVFLHCKEPNEFWSALLEKAYAKLHGSYEALSGALPYEALEDFTGGLAEIYQLNKAPAGLFEILLDASRRSSFMCSYILEAGLKLEAREPMGLSRRHGYSITAVKEVEIKGSVKLQMIRLWNPWGPDAEWKGPWSDQSVEWRSLSNEEKQAFGLTFDAEGEFWMSFTDFIQKFTDLEIVSLAADNPPGRIESLAHGSWIAGQTAGGNLAYKSTYHMNPQFCIRLPQKSDGQVTTCCVLVALMQEYNRRLRKDDVDQLWIGFQIFRVLDDREQRLDRDFFKRNQPIYDSNLSESREVSGRVQLKAPGHYVIVPCAFKPKEEGDFILRIHFDEQIEIKLLDGLSKTNDAQHCAIF